MIVRTPWSGWAPVITKQKMFDNDEFSKWLGIEFLEISAGFCKLKMIVRSEMTQGFKIAHGGVTYSLADSALAFASNSHGRMSMSIETSISHTAKVNVGDALIATATENNCTDKIAIYNVEVKNQNEITVALFKGTVYRTAKEWEL